LIFGLFCFVRRTNSVQKNYFWALLKAKNGLFSRAHSISKCEN
jgi:hypothetical protein